MTCDFQLSTLNALLRLAFHHFYTTFAWTYDAVSVLVSFGEWKAWGRAVLTQVPAGARVLELAHGPGHLHLHMRQCGFNVASLDLSPQMGRMLSRRVDAHAMPHQHVQASAMQLPFANAQFDCVISTFPTEFIFAPSTLSEVRRVLVNHGTLVIVPSVQMIGSGMGATLVRLAYQVTGQKAPSVDIKSLRQARFRELQFDFNEQVVTLKHAQVYVWVCEKRGL